MLGSNFKIKHVFAFLFLFLKLLEHNLGLITLSLKLMLQFHRHLSLSFEMLGLLDSFCHASTLDLVLNLEVFFVPDALFSENVINLRVAHISLTLEIFHTLVSN